MRRTLLVVAIFALALSTRAPAAQTRAVEAVSTGPGGGPCEPVDTGGPLVDGGCEAFAHALTVDLTLRTALGAMPFGSCAASFDVHLARDGRVWLDRLKIGGVTPCGDVWLCAPRSVLERRADENDPPPVASAIPWTGRFVADGRGRFVADVRVCLGTCVGRFGGRTRFELVAGDASWRLRARDAGIGLSGMAIDGEWELKSASFDLRAV